LVCKAKLMDEPSVNRAIIRISHEIIERNRGAENLCLVGIRRRGVPLANQIAAVIKQSEKISVPVGILDITLYRDDLTSLSDFPLVNATDIPFPVAGKRVVLVDDVNIYGENCTRRH
jgi:pyrimidine operon attenuation protein/uracil phosphoribosyltransferase